MGEGALGPGNGLGHVYWGLGRRTRGTVNSLCLPGWALLLSHAPPELHLW